MLAHGLVLSGKSDKNLLRESSKLNQHRGRERTCRKWCCSRDDYDFLGGNPYPFAGSSNMTRGLLTASKVYVLGTSHMLWSVDYYDEDGRAIKNFKQHKKS